MSNVLVRRYLYEAKNVIVRGLWLVCIASCFTAAVVIIRCNIVNWQNSPAVITQAKPTLIKVQSTSEPLLLSTLNTNTL